MLEKLFRGFDNRPNANKHSPCSGGFRDSRRCEPGSFGAKCSICTRGISSSDWVRKARDHVYHLACFACAACHRQLSTGEEFALHEERVLCKAHYLEILDGGTTSSDDGCDAEGYHKNKAKRVRTTFTEEQLQVLQANFQLDSNPDGQDLERIAQITGLSKRVTQVWFQNSRARQKKHMHTGKVKNQSGFDKTFSDPTGSLVSATLSDILEIPYLTFWGIIVSVSFRSEFDICHPTF
uniref:LIM/homeobox protein Awh-like n=1 Tax=Diabrotica virgifera virgifera TaxID=50390 RepID=A0A6P7GE12_DIAVI